ncbi:MAG TPA: protease pro-enzyme activation domain-containing protein [Polyangia bacterium]
MSSRSLLIGSAVFLSVLSCDRVPLEEDNAGHRERGASSGLAKADIVAVVNPLQARPRDRVRGTIDPQDTVVLEHNRHPLARPELETGRVPPDQLMESMILLLHADSAQDQSLEALIRAQNDSSSPLYHQWLTPGMYAERFGISDSDVTSTTNWLISRGMRVEQVVNGGRQILFAGKAAQVETAFHTTMRTYRVNGEIHLANASDPEIPRGLASVVSGVVSLHDFRAIPTHVPAKALRAENTQYHGGVRFSTLVPQDVATIYNATPLYEQSIDGTGQSIAIIGGSSIDLAAVRNFRNKFGLPAKDPRIILAGTDPATKPGNVSDGYELEAHLDVEWAGAIAKNATIDFVTAASTVATEGLILAALYTVSHNVAPIVSISYGNCEQNSGVSANAFLNALWQQAAAQGISVLVSSGDSGAAGCDQMDAMVGTKTGVNAMGSTPYNTAVGGTQFDDVSNLGTYWASTNDSVTQASALGYIPELAWNESNTGGLFSTGGGQSLIYTKPAWQFGLGVLADGKRDVPDVAFAAAAQDCYLVYVGDELWGVGGTSASSPVFASIMALVLQKTGQAQGLLNPTLYALAYNQNYGNGAAVFHDVTQGNNTVPGVAGYAAGPGFDMATGLGSVDVTQLVNHWQEGVTLANFKITAVAPSAFVLPAGGTTADFTVKTTNGTISAIQFSITGLPAGVTATFAPEALSSSGTTTLTLDASASAKPGVYTAQVVGTSSSTSHSEVLVLTVINAPPLTMTLSSPSITLAAGSMEATKIVTTRSSAFDDAVTLSTSGVPKGMSLQFAPATIAAPGAGTSTLVATVVASMASGTYPVTVTATGGGLTKTALLAINVLQQPVSN